MPPGKQHTPQRVGGNRRVTASSTSRGRDDETATRAHTLAPHESNPKPPTRHDLPGTRVSQPRTLDP